VDRAPLADGRLVGRQLRYLIGSEHGWLGALGFGSCALRLRERDAWIGWDRATRQRFQERVINMTRFLIRPQVRCQNLASRVLSLCAERVGETLPPATVSSLGSWKASWIPRSMREPAIKLPTGCGSEPARDEDGARRRRRARPPRRSMFTN